MGASETSKRCSVSIECLRKWKAEDNVIKADKKDKIPLFLLHEMAINLQPFFVINHNLIFCYLRRLS